jgi:hypothetical protein
MSFERLSDEHVPNSAELFLDTSIHCSKLKGSLFASRIADVFRRFRWKSTSTYTKVEFGNVVLAQAEYFLTKLEEFKSLERTNDFIGNVLPHRLHSIKVTWAFNLLKAYGANDAECTERARLSLRRLMKLGVAFVEQVCDRPLANGTDCYWARLGVHKRKDGRLEWRTPICKRTHKRCRLDEFFVENQEVFQKIKDAIDTLVDDEKKTPQLRGFSEVIGHALTDPASLLDYRTGCKRLADAIIAVDSLAHRNLFSQNAAESELLTTVLRQTFYYLPPNPDQGVLVQLAPKE